MEQPPKDKRTKAYKEWKKKFDDMQETNPKGLGDVIEKITEATGIKKAVKFLAGEDCGCDQRKMKLNQMFRHNKIECLNEDEYEFLQEWFSKRRSTINNEYKVRLYEIYNRIFNKNQKPSSCSSCVVSVILRLEKVFNEYR
jgi:hypothetical protein